RVGRQDAEAEYLERHLQVPLVIVHNGISRVVRGAQDERADDADAGGVQGRDRVAVMGHCRALVEVVQPFLSHRLDAQKYLAAAGAGQLTSLPVVDRLGSSEAVPGLAES